LFSLICLSDHFQDAPLHIIQLRGRPRGSRADAPSSKKCFIYEIKK